MTAVNGPKAECTVCHRQFDRAAMRDGAGVSPGVTEMIRADLPDWHAVGPICREDLSHYRSVYLEHLLRGERAALSALDQEVLASLKTGAPVAQDIDTAFEGRRTLGERAADAVASFGGSWTFISLFCAVLVVWIAVNVTRLLGAGFDPYPFILLNLLLSCVAALQAPIIMMSQRRTEAKDRLRAENDYKVNLKAELEIRHLHDKIDYQLAGQWNRLVEIQRIQIEMLEEAAKDAHASESRGR